MPLRAVANLSLPDQVFEQLASEILTGRYSAGENLPAERKLVEAFGVNRHVVREALKRLEQLGLIRISQGGGTKVLDFRRTAGLDVLALMAEHAHVGPSSMALWLSVHEMRMAIAADVSRLCAERASAALKGEIVEIAREMRALQEGAQLFTLELRFWDKVLEGADNLAYRLAFNSLLRGIFSPRIGDVAQMAATQELKQSDYRLPIAEAIHRGDADAAEAAAKAAMRQVVQMLSVLVRGPQPGALIPSSSEPASVQPAEHDDRLQRSRSKRQRSDESA